MDKDLQAEIDNWRADYLHLGYELGEIINEQQDKIISLSQENKRLKREIWNMKQTKRRRR
ncbi:hypothetical protein VYH85_10905 [Streptococcus anginosus]|uniref:Phage protein n=1 Tax=Streptococcus anginosus TaxID=1328 RepID=A0AAW5TCC1_STRAP|nr:hypothetical protein [Streptococcus anginosus]MCW1037006.1 hypothetical protein [Streptococcus anginosus]MCW1053155.1 hypothetical protein [Streptococcus anginosus]MCW1071816.1 hypothetical protein [Streptococcus anginosus]MDU4568030.1 hypothetical protein [Streptococcus anginosus]MDU4574016.1 hypothetical protein [Streptococcus anginosus]